MKKINTYIIEKLKINNDIKSINLKSLVSKIINNYDTVQDVCKNGKAFTEAILNNYDVKEIGPRSTKFFTENYGVYIQSQYVDGTFSKFVICISESDPNTYTKVRVNYVLQFSLLATYWDPKTNPPFFEFAATSGMSTPDIKSFIGSKKNIKYKTYFSSDKKLIEEVKELINKYQTSPNNLGGSSKYMKIYNKVSDNEDIKPFI